MIGETTAEREIAGQEAKPLAAGKQVVYFADLYADHNAPELGMAAVGYLRSLGCHVVVPADSYSGYPYFAYGDVIRSRRVAENNVKLLLEYVRDGFEIVSTEPTATHCLKSLYPRLLDNDTLAVEVAEHSHAFFTYVLRTLDGAIPPGAALTLKGRRLGFHIACHQRGLDGGRDTIEWLQRQGAEVVVVENGTCCGMGGTFGMKSGPLGRDLALAVGGPLFDAFREAEIESIVTESSVCRIHIEQGTGLRAFHPLELTMTTTGSQP